MTPEDTARPFYEESPIRYTGGDFLNEYSLQNDLYGHCLKHGLTAYQTWRSATVKNFQAFVEGLPVKFKFFTEVLSYTPGAAPWEMLGVYGNDFIHIHNGAGKTKNAQLSVTIYTTSTERLGLYRQYLKTSMRKTVSHGHVYVIALDNQGQPQLNDLGLASSPFLEDNYEERVVTAVKHIAADLQSPKPCGRISILDGPPGCGKTYLLRSIFDILPEAYFVLLPPTLVPQLTGPQLMNVILKLKSATPSINSRQKSTRKAKPAVLVLEDADEVLVPRANDNMPAISTLLNFSDGIMGSCVDLRILATTNSKFEDMDAALLRHGRLCRRFKVEPLSLEQALKVFWREVGGIENLRVDGFQPTGPTTLADVYYQASVARGDKPEDADNRRKGASLGFASGSSSDSPTPDCMPGGAWPKFGHG